MSWVASSFILGVSASCGSLPHFDLTLLTANHIQQALEDYGGFYLSNHSLLHSLQQSMFLHAAEFFSQSRDAKQEFHIKFGLDLRWNEAGAESTYGQTDSRETLYVAPNVCNPSTKNTCVAHFTELQKLAFNISTISSAIGADLLSLISVSLGLTPTYLGSLFPDTPQPVLLTHSHHRPPALASSTTPFNVGAHSDWGALTLLMLTGESHGLQMRCPSDHEQWIDVPPVAGAFVVTAGDVLDTWSGGRYAASVHRVRHVADEHRYAIPLFLDPKPELIVENLVDFSSDSVSGLPFRERSYQGLSNAFLHLSSSELRGLLS